MTEAYKGELPKLRVVKNSSQVIADALKWGKWITQNNTFHYGEYGKKDYATKGSKYYAGGKYVPIYNVTHSCGCHFCGTEKRKKKDKATKLGYNGENWEYTYVCNTFVTAMYAHGGMIPAILKKCQAGKCIGMNEKGRSSVLDKSADWTYLGKIPMKDLKAGDILVTASHMQCVYAPISNSKVKIIEATSYYGKYPSEASDKSIRIIEKSPSYTSVYRFTGKVDANLSIIYGEYSDRVILWQRFLNWMGYDCGTADGKFGDKTLKATKNFQTKYQLEADGIVGAKSLAMAQDCVKRLLVVEIPTSTPTPVTPTTEPTKKYIGLIPDVILKKGSKNPYVSFLQKFLNWYNANNALVTDDDFGVKTEEALKNYQKAENLVVDGVWGQKSYAAANKYAVTHSYKVEVDLTNQIATVYDNNTPIISEFVSTAKEGATTPTGNFKIGPASDGRVAKSRTATMSSGTTYAEFLCRFHNGKCMHTVPYKERQTNGHVFKGEFNKLGKIASAGCVRMPNILARFIYTNCPNGTPVIVFKGKAGTYPMGKPKKYTATSDIDPTYVPPFTTSTESTPAPKPVETPKQAYTGAFPDWVALSGNIIMTTARQLAYAKGTKKANYTYGIGKATPAFTAAINKVFPNRSSWSKQCQAGASCDVGAATVLRYCGASTSIPRGLAEQIPFMKNNSRFKDMKLTTTANFKPGDVGFYLNKKSGGHIWINIDGSTIAESNHTSKYFLHLIARKYTNSGKKYFACFKMVVPIRKYMKRGDTGSEIIKLQKFLLWAGYNCGMTDGDFGARTEAAVKAFQTKNGLKADGIFGELSLSKAKSIKK